MSAKLLAEGFIHNSHKGGGGFQHPKHSDKAFEKTAFGSEGRLRDVVFWKFSLVVARYKIIF